MNRRDLLLTIGVATASSTVAAHQHHSADPAAALAPAAPVYFSPTQYQQLQLICQLVIPSDSESPGAKEAGVPVFIDLLTSENKEYQRRISGGLAWLDAQAINRFEAPFAHSTPAQQQQLLHAIAFRANAEEDPVLAPGIDFFAFLRGLILDGFFTSQQGIRYLDYRGNGALAEFPGCPQPSSYILS